MRKRPFIGRWLDQQSDDALQRVSDAPSGWTHGSYKRCLLTFTHEITQELAVKVLQFVDVDVFRQLECIAWRFDDIARRLGSVDRGNETGTERLRVMIQDRARRILAQRQIANMKQNTNQTVTIQ